MARRKLERTLTEYEYEDAIINGHKAEESMEDIYHMLRKKYGILGTVYLIPISPPKTAIM